MTVLSLSPGAYEAYNNGTMDPADKKQLDDLTSQGYTFESKEVVTPQTAQDAPPTPDTPESGSSYKESSLSDSAWNAYFSDEMDPEDKKAIDTLIDEGKETPPKPNKVSWGDVSKFWTGSAEEQDRFLKGIKTGRIELPEASTYLPEIEEFVTGQKRIVESTEALPTWYKMPEMNDYKLTEITDLVGLATADTDEAVKMIKSRNPKVKTRKDEKGNWILKSKNGKEYAIHPGLRTEDTPKILSSVILYGLASTGGVIPRIAKTMALQTGIETAQKAGGGDFDAEQIPISGFMEGVIPGAKAAKKGIQGAVAKKALKAGEEVTEEALSETVRQATKGGKKGIKALETFAEQSKPDKKMIAAAERLGIAEHLQPDHVTTNQVYREVSQAIKSIPGSEARAAELKGFEQITKKADDIIENLGGTRDLSSLDYSVKNEINSTIKNLESSSSALYNKVTKSVPPKTPAPATGTVDFLKNKADEMLGVQNLSKEERDILKKLAPAGGKQKAEVIKTEPWELSKSEYNVTKAGGGFGGNDIKLDSGSRVTYFTKNRDFPGEKMIPDRAEIYYVESKKRGDGKKLLKAALNEVKESGASTVVMSPQTKAGKKLTQKFIDTGVLGKPTKTSQTGKMEFNITVPSDKTPTYALLDQTRKDIGAALSKKQGPFKDVDSGRLKKLYGLLSKDQESVLRGINPKLAEDYAMANKGVVARKAFEDDLKAVYGKNLEKSIVGPLSTSIKKLPQGDVNNFLKLMKAVPEGMRKEVTASGLATAFGATAKNGKLSFNSYARWFEGLSRNKQARNAIFTNLTSSERKSLFDLYRVSKGIGKASKERITTGRSGIIQKQIQGADNLLRDIYKTGAKAGIYVGARKVLKPAGMVGEGLSMGIASILTKGKGNALQTADKLIGSPEFIYLAKNIGTEAQEKAIKRLAKSNKMKMWMKASDKPIETGKIESWIRASIQTTRQLKEDNER